MGKIFVIITLSAFFVTTTGAIPGYIYNYVETYPKSHTSLLASDRFSKENKFEGNGIVETKPNIIPLAAPASLTTIPMPVAPGTLVQKNDKAAIDYSNTKDGYVMARYLGKAGKAVRLIVKCPSGESYTYSLNVNGANECFPLSEGNGSYQVGVYENIIDAKYSAVISATFQVTLTDEFAPFLRPNQYVNYNSGSQTVAKASEIVKGSSGILAKVSSVYSYVTKSITYDKELAKTVRSGYLPNVDAVLAKGKGICFDYAAVMTAMLRSQQIPTKLVIGYMGSAYHAWINVYSTETGWIDKAVYFDGTRWKLIDPTFAANQNAGAATDASYIAKLTY